MPWDYSAIDNYITITILAKLFKVNWHLIFGPICGYLFVWIGHFVFEKNKPATFKYPIYSLVSDFIMFYHMLTLQMNKQMEKHGIKVK